MCVLEVKPGKAVSIIECDMNVSRLELYLMFRDCIGIITGEMPSLGTIFYVIVSEKIMKIWH